MKFSVVLALFIYFVGTSTGILIAWGAYFPALPTLWSEIIAIGLGALLLALSIGLSRTVVKGLTMAYEQSLVRRFPAAIWLWRRDWRRRMSSAEITSGLSIVIAVLICAVSVVVAMIARFAPDERAAWVGFVSLLGTALIGLLADSGFRRARAPLSNLLYFDDDPATRGGTAAYHLSVPRRKDTDRWECFLVCDHIVNEWEQNGRGSAVSDRRVELWRSGVFPQSLIAGERHEIKPRFDIPIEAAPTGPYLNGRVEWRVIVHGVSRLSEVTYDNSFVVPVSAASRGATDVRWATTSDQQDTFDFDHIDPVLGEKHSSIIATNTAMLGPVWKGLADGLASAHIELLQEGMYFGEKAWQTTTAYVRARLGAGLWTVALVALLVLVWMNDVWSLSVGVSCAIAAGGACLGLGQSLFNLFHRFDLVFQPDLLIIRHRWLGRRWDRSVSWVLFQTITWERVVCSVPECRRVVVNPDGGRLCRVVSPLLTDGVVVDNIIDALELCRAVFRQPRVLSPRDFRSLRLESSGDFITVPGYNTSGVLGLH